MFPALSITTWVLYKCLSSGPFSWKPPSDNQMLDSLQQMTVCKSLYPLHHLDQNTPSQENESTI